MNKPYDFKPRACKWCEKDYKPTGGRQFYCVDCRGVAARAQKMIWWKKNGRDYDREYKRTHSSSPYIPAQYRTNDIIEKTDFLDMIRERVRAQKGDMLSVKKIVRYVLDKMSITSVSFGAKKSCYRATEDVIVDEFGGVLYGISDYGGIVFKLPKERMM